MEKLTVFQQKPVCQMCPESSYGNTHPTHMINPRLSSMVLFDTDPNIVLFVILAFSLMNFKLPFQKKQKHHLQLVGLITKKSAKYIYVEQLNFEALKSGLRLFVCNDIWPTLNPHADYPPSTFLHCNASIVGPTGGHFLN